MKKLIILVFLSTIWSLNIWSQNNYDNNLIIKDFHQGIVNVPATMKKCAKDFKNGNCVTVAIIKAALVEFQSLDNIFKNYEIKKDSIFCIFYDNISSGISNDDIELAKDISRIEKDSTSKYYNDAIIIYSLICKRILIQRNKFKEGKCINNIADAMDFINTGFITANGNNLLGLNKKNIKKRKIKKYRSVIIWTGAHASYCSFGNQDIFGKKHKIKLGWMKNPRGIGGFISKAYRLTKP